MGTHSGIPEPGTTRDDREHTATRILRLSRPAGDVPCMSAAFSSAPAAVRSPGRKARAGDPGSDMQLPYGAALPVRSEALFSGESDPASGPFLPAQAPVVRARPLSTGCLHATPGAHGPPDPHRTSPLPFAPSTGTPDNHPAEPTGSPPRGRTSPPHGTTAVAWIATGPRRRRSGKDAGMNEPIP